MTESDFGYPDRKALPFDSGVCPKCGQTPPILQFLDGEAFGFSESNLQGSITLGRFTQPDSVIPDLTNSHAWNRYSYTLNSPIMYVDPSGHEPCIEGDCNYQDDLLEEIYDNSGYRTLGDGELGELRNSGNLSEDGVLMLDLYSWFRDTLGWWNNYEENNFSLIDFLAITLYIEYAQGPSRPDFLNKFGESAYHKLKYIGSTYHNGMINSPIEALFMYIGERESMQFQYDDGFPSATESNWNYIGGYTPFLEFAEQAFPTVSGIHNYTINESAPFEWGNYYMFVNNGQQLRNASIGTADNQVLDKTPYYDGMGLVLFTQSQSVNYWSAFRVDQ